MRCVRKLIILCIRSNDSTRNQQQVQKLLITDKCQQKLGVLQTTVRTHGSSPAAICLVDSELVSHRRLDIHRVSKNKQKYFCYNYVKLPPNPTIFGTKMANCLSLYEVHSFSTSPNSCQCNTVLIADVPNCHITL